MQNIHIRMQGAHTILVSPPDFVAAPRPEHVGHCAQPYRATSESGDQVASPKAEFNPKPAPA